MPRTDFTIVDNKPIGCGQFGTVFLARRANDQRHVALKLVLHRGEGGDDRVAAERHGAILQQRFEELHGMVPEVYDFGPDGDDLFIAMEYIDGPSLEEVLRAGALPPAEAVEHAIWLCEFLDKAHGFSCTVEGKPYRLLHNDLKPAHLKISLTGERKVLDFGIAKALEDTRELTADVARTIAYAAPERLHSERVNVHADFWSMGVMLYEMVCGHRPYKSLDGPRFRRQLYHAITTNAPREPLPPQCPPHLAAIINRLLAFQPEHRYQHPAAIRADLERFLRDEVPEAAAYYDTPATIPVSRAAAAAVGVTPETLPVDAASGAAIGLVDVPATEPVPAPAPVPPTEPVPHMYSPVVPVTVPSTDPVPGIVKPPPPSIRRRPRIARIGSAMIAFAFVWLVATEGVAWLAAERFRDTIPEIDERTVTARKEAYDAVARWSGLDVGLRLRVDRDLLRTLRSVGDRVIADYRREVPMMGPLEWKQALEAFTWARELSPREPSLRAKQLIADAHVRRLALPRDGAGTAATLAAQAVVAKFRAAAEQDDALYDPYLGMAITQVYALRDVDGAAASIDEAVKRGFRTTRRETALLGDGYARRGLSSLSRARVLTGEQSQRELQKAREDYTRCVAMFESIVEFGRSAKNLELCKAQVVRIDRQLAEIEY